MATTAHHIMYILQCDHVMMCATEFLSADHTVWCGECKVHQTVSDVHIYEWRAKCVLCTFSRWCGLSDTVAKRLAYAHERSTMHKTDVQYAINPRAVHEQNRLHDARVI